MAGPQGLIHVSLLTPPSQQSLPQEANAALRPGIGPALPWPGNSSLGNRPLKAAPAGGAALQADSYPGKTKAKGPKFSRRYRGEEVGDAHLEMGTTPRARAVQDATSGRLSKQANFNAHSEDAGCSGYAEPNPTEG